MVLPQHNSLKKSIGNEFHFLSQVGGIKPGCFKIGNTGGMLDNILASKLYRPGRLVHRAVPSPTPLDVHMLEMCKNFQPVTQSILNPLTVIFIDADYVGALGFELLLGNATEAHPPLKQYCLYYSKQTVLIVFNLFIQ